MKKYGSIYKITNKINNMCYVGQTTNSINYRFMCHSKETRNRHISNSMRKYGKENFIIEEICSVFDKKSLNELEIFFVNYFNTLHPNGYNHRAGGNQNGICSQELKNKISKAKTGKPNYKRRGEIRTFEQRVKISRGLGGQRIVAKNLKTGEIKFYETVQSTKLDGHNPSNVVSICKNNRNMSKGWTFYYESNYVNQSGSAETKETVHAQRIEFEPAKAE